MITSTAIPTPKPARAHTPRPPPSPLSKLATRDVTLRHRGAIPSSTKTPRGHVASIHARPYFSHLSNFFLISFFTVVPKGLTMGPTNLTIYFLKKSFQKYFRPFFGAPGLLPSIFKHPFSRYLSAFFPTFRTFFSLPSSRFPLHLHPRLVVILLTSKVQTGVTNLWPVAHTRSVFFTLPNLNHAYVTSFQPPHDYPSSTDTPTPREAKERDMPTPTNQIYQSPRRHLLTT